MTNEETIELLKAATEIFERLRIGIYPFVEATITQNSSLKLNQDELKTLSRYSHNQDQPAKDTLEYQDIDITGLLYLMGADDGQLSIKYPHLKSKKDRLKAAFRRELGGSSGFLGKLTDLRKYRNQVAHSNSWRPIKEEQVVDLAAQALLWLRSLPNSYSTAKDQLYPIRNVIKRLTNLDEPTSIPSQQKAFDAEKSEVREDQQETPALIPEEKDQAIALMVFINETLPENAEAVAYWNRANEHDQAAEFDEALANLNQAIELCPDQRLWLFRRARLFIMLNRLQEAIADYSKLIAIRLESHQPEIPGLYSFRGDSYRDSKQLQSAIADYIKAIQLNPKSAGAHRALADCYAEMGEDQLAIAHYNQAVKCAPDSAWSFQNLGDYYADIGQYADAISNYNRAIELNPDSDKAYISLGFAKASLGDHKGAIADYTQSMTAGRRRSTVTSPELGVPDPVINEIIAFTPSGGSYYRQKDANAYVSRANSYLALGRYQEAVEDYTTAINIKPTAERYRARATAYELWSDQATGAEQDDLFQKAIDDDEESNRLEEGE